MGLPYIDKNALIAEAGGDPWAINASLQAGSPLQISNLAKAFHRAGRCTAESDSAFQQALTRFEVAWNHQDGGHPINDSAEVQRVVQSLGAQSLQLPKIGTDLENIAAALADAQKAGAARIATLDAQLKNISDPVVHAVALLSDPSLSAADKDAVHAFINTCEDDALRDTNAALAALQSIRNGYSDGLQKSLTNLHAEGYDGAPLHGADADGVAPPSPDQQAALADIRQATKQAVADQLAKVRAARDALNKAAADLYMHGPGSPEGEAANARLPKLKADLKQALDDLRKIPDYDGIDPASINVAPDGHFMFTYNVNGQSVQAFGQLKNGTGEFFDQATGTYYTFNGGKLTGMRTPDPGQVQATPEPLWTAITLAVGGPGLKAGGEALLQGAKMLFSREAFEGLTSESLTASSLSGPQLREALAEAEFPSHGAIGVAVSLSPALTRLSRPRSSTRRRPTHPSNTRPRDLTSRPRPIARCRCRRITRRRRLRRTTLCSMDTIPLSRARNSPTLTVACDIPTTRWRPNLMQYPGLSFRTPISPQVPFSADSATPGARTWLLREHLLLNFPFPREVLPNRSTNMSCKIRLRYRRVGI